MLSRRVPGNMDSWRETTKQCVCSARPGVTAQGAHRRECTARGSGDGAAGQEGEVCKLESALPRGGGKLLQVSTPGRDRGRFSR